MSSILTSEELYQQTHSIVLQEYYLVYIYSFVVIFLLSAAFFIYIPTKVPHIVTTYIFLILVFLIGFPRII